MSQEIKYTFEYDPIRGYCCPDGLVKDHVDYLVRSPGYSLIGSELIILEIRCRILSGELDYKNVEFQFEETIIKPNEKGILDSWPTGFCDTTDPLLQKIAGWETS